MTHDEIAVAAWQRMTTRQRDIATKPRYSFRQILNRLQRYVPTLTLPEREAVASWVLRAQVAREWANVE